jgi:hypothetical protein
LAALAVIATETGKSRRACFAALRTTWNLGLGELAQLEHALSTTPEPTKPDPAAVKAATAAQQGVSAIDAQRDVRDLATFRAWRAAKDADPVRAAQLMNSVPLAISRGRALDSTPDNDPTPPPKAA